MIKGIDVILYDKAQTGVDSFNKPIWSEVPTTINNVLVSPLSSEDILSEINLSGKKVVYELGIPKGDNHIWEDKVVEFYGEKFRTVGKATQGIEANIPLLWNKKIKVEQYG